MVIMWIKQKTKLNNIKFKKIDRKDNNNYNNFYYKHNYYQEKSNTFYDSYEIDGPTLILIKTNKNKIFGGFTPLCWKKNSGELYDKSNQTFLFSLNAIKIFDLKNDESIAIKCKSDFGPIFGNEDLSLDKNLTSGEIKSTTEISFNSFRCIDFIGKEEN